MVLTPTRIKHKGKNFSDPRRDSGGARAIRTGTNFKSGAKWLSGGGEFLAGIDCAQSHAPFANQLKQCTSPDIIMDTLFLDEMFLRRLFCDL